MGHGRATFKELGDFGMSDISDIMWETMKDIWMEMAHRSCERFCEEYEFNPKYKLKKYYENGKLVGFSVYYDTPEYRMLEAGYHIGTNKLEFIREWHKIIKDVKVLRAYIQKPNIRMIEFYKKMKFKIISEDLNNYIFERIN